MARFLRHIRAALGRAIRWWLRALERRPFAGILAAAALLLTFGTLLRFAVPRDALVISAFDVSEEPRLPFSVSGRTVANELSDALQGILDTAADFTGEVAVPHPGRAATYDGPLGFAMRLRSQELQNSPVRRVALSTPTKPLPVGLEVEGLSVERIRAEWSRLRQRQLAVTGDAIVTAQGLTLRARIPGRGMWETAVIGTTVQGLDQAAHQLALKVLASTYPSVIIAYHLDRGLALRRHGRLCEELQDYHQAAASGDDPYVDLLLGVALLDSGAVDSAVAAFHRAINLRPLNSDLLFVIGTELQRGHRLADATDMFLQALRIKPGSGGAQFNLALAYADRGMLSEAKTTWLAFLQNHPDDRDAWNGLAWMHYQHDSLAQAAAYSDSSLARLAPAAPRGSYMDTRANIWLDSGNPTRALELWDQGLRDSLHSEPYLHAGRAMALLELGRRSEAVTEYRRAITQDSSYAELGYLRDAAGYSSKALDRFRTLGAVPRTRSMVRRTCA